jgi:hypothetical protein
LNARKGARQQKVEGTTMKLAHCIECGCHDMAACHDEATGGPCSWLVVDRHAGKGVCSACEEGLKRWKAGDREFAVPVELGLREHADDVCQPFLTAEVFNHLTVQLGAQGVADVEWAESLAAPTNADAFAKEVIFVICNSGMKHTVARGIYERCIQAIEAEVDVRQVFRHPGKAAAIADVWLERAKEVASESRRDRPVIRRN